MDFRVGQWLVQPGTGTISQEGRTCHITPKSMEVLVCLAKRQGRIATREEIFHEVWPGTFVSDDALTRCIGELRRAFHDDARAPAIIRTLAKRGYVTAAPVIWDAAGEGDLATRDLTPDASGAGGSGATTESAHSARLRPAPAIVAGACLAVAAILLAWKVGGIKWKWDARPSRPAIQRVAVLPFTDVSGDSGQEYFAEGVTDQLITELAQICSWKVTSRTSVMRYKATTRPVREIAQELGVDALVEGSVLRSSGRVRITAQFIDASTDTHLWSGSLERDARDVIALQGQVARAIASELGIALGPEQRSRLARTRSVVPEAFESYLKGQYFFNRYQFEKAAVHFAEATKSDPGFALAHAYLYEADAMESFGRDEPVSGRALAAMKAALALDDELAEAHSDAAAVKFFWGWDWKGGEAEFRRAVELDRGSVHSASHYAMCLHILRRWDEPWRNTGVLCNWIPFRRG